MNWPQVIAIAACTIGAVAILAAMLRPDLDRILGGNIFGLAAGIGGFLLMMLSIAAFFAFEPVPKTYADKSKEVYDSGRDVASRTLEESRKKTEEALKSARKSAENAWQWTRDQMPDTSRWWPPTQKKEVAQPQPLPKKPAEPTPPVATPWWPWSSSPTEQAKK
ncbi:MAG: hypothetical protein KBE09_01970 [Candidatus Pacebacteria bacterium]|nr:hypothetical protein [Candidatus Paceibacterota bacterium]